jgi:hypothetical protein
MLYNAPRTTNCLEAWHRNFNFRCNTAHLNLGGFIDVLIHEVEKIRIVISQTKKQMYIDKNNLLKKNRFKFWLNYDLFSNFEFFELCDAIIVWKLEM